MDGAATAHMSRHKPGPSAYNHGCRCAECTELHRLRHAAARVVLAARPRSEAPHGTTGGYCNWSCRCEACSEANAAACRRQRARATKPLGD
jgi:hypothetical protein